MSFLDRNSKTREVYHRWPYDSEDMHYVCDLSGGQLLTLQNEGTVTHVGFHSTAPGQQQSQRVGIETGAWTSKPEVLRMEDDLVLRIESEKGSAFFSLRGNRITPLSSPPRMENAKAYTLREADADARFKPMEPMSPMRPMEPMKPMEPMEMRMGNMSMKMGEESASGTTRTKKYCTQCGNALGPEDRFCGNCGHKV